MILFLLAAALVIPPKYDHPFNGVVEVMEDARTFCGRPDALGCAMIGAKDYCIVHIVPGLPPKQRQRVIRHEIAHCNGWDHS